MTPTPMGGEPTRPAPIHDLSAFAFTLLKETEQRRAYCAAHERASLPEAERSALPCPCWLGWPADPNCPRHGAHASAAPQ